MHRYKSDYTAATHILVACMLLEGCAVAPPVLSGQYETNKSFKETAVLLSAQAEKCWTNPVSPFAFGIRIDSKIALDDSVVISAYRITWDKGMEPNAFATIHVKPAAGFAKVEVQEGEFVCSMIGCRKIGVTPHVEKWLAGDLQCFEFSRSLANAL